MKDRHGLASLVSTLAVLAALLPGGAQAAPPPRFSKPVHHPLRREPVTQAAITSVKPGTLISPGPASYIPCDLANAYHVAGTALTGSGVTIAIVDYSDQPSVLTDLQAFDSNLGLPDPAFSKIEVGTPPPAAATGWDAEIALDVEWAHALAPGARILLVETADSHINVPSNGTDMIAGIQAAANAGADVVSMSWGAAVGPADVAALNAADALIPITTSSGAPITYLAAAGDSAFGPQWPAISPRVVGVGGTSLDPPAFGYSGPPNTVNHTSAGTYACAPTQTPGVDGANERVWGASPANPWTPAGVGTGGGQIGGYGEGVRSMPDVAADSDPRDGGVSIVRNGAWDSGIGGTSLAAPLWAGITALLDQQRTAAGALRLGGNLWVSAARAADFNDITTGSSPDVAPNPSPDPCVTSGACVAQPGYDLVTGRGSPLFPALVADAGSPRGGPFVPLAQPVRIVDTRRQGIDGANTTCMSALGPGAQCSTRISGNATVMPKQVPGDAIAAVVNVTATDATQGTYLSVFPTGTPVPNSSSVNVYPGQQVANLVEVNLGGGSINIFNSQGNVDVIVDLEGYVAGPSEAAAPGRFGTSGPSRIADTRSTKTPLAPGKAMNVQVTGAAGVSAAVVNLTVTDTGAAGYLTVVPAGQAIPQVSNLNYAAGQTIANRVMTALGSGSITVFNGGSAPASVIVDLYGTYSGSGSLFYPVGPIRVLDTRNAGWHPIPGGQTLQLVNPVPGATALVGNFTVTDGSTPSYITVGAAAGATSDINFVTNQVQANLCVPPISNNAVVIGNSQGLVDVVADLTGWYS